MDDDSGPEPLQMERNSKEFPSCESDNKEENGDDAESDEIESQQSCVLPTEICVKILNLLSPSDLHANAALVCRQWRNIIRIHRFAFGMMDRPYATTDEYGVDANTIRLTIHNFSNIEESSFLSSSKIISYAEWKLEVVYSTAFYATLRNPENWIGLYVRCCPIDSKIRGDWSCTVKASMRLLTRKEGTLDHTISMYETFDKHRNYQGFNHFKNVADMVEIEGSRFVKNDSASFEVSVEVLDNRTMIPPEEAFQRTLQESFDQANIFMHNGKVKEALTANEEAIEMCKNTSNMFLLKLREQKTSFLKTIGFLEATESVAAEPLKKLFDTRIREELNRLRDDPPMLFSAGPIREDDLYNWQATIVGAPESLYEDGSFGLKIDLFDYPYKPPSVKFTTPIYHPNISSQGDIQLPILDPSQWTMNKTVADVLEAICSSLSCPIMDSCAEPEIAQIFKNNRTLFNHTAREWTRKICRSQ